MTDPLQDLQLTLSIAEVNQILKALGQLKYADVFQLVSKIQQQADTQLNERKQPPGQSLLAPDQPPND